MMFRIIRRRWLTLFLFIFLPIMAVAQSEPSPEVACTGWLDMVSRTQENQPHWATPLATVTARLEQEFRYDQYSQMQGNGSSIENFGGGKGLELIPTYNTEVILGIPPYQEETVRGRTSYGLGDWSPLLVKYRILSQNETSGDYILTGFFQVVMPTGTTGLSNGLYLLQPTIAFGKGWGDFDIQATLSEQFPVGSMNAVDSQSAFGNPILANMTFQYHLASLLLWPELEVNYEFWPSGTHQGLTQVLLTPGVVVGRIPISGRVNLIFGVGYQVAVTADPVVNNNLDLTARLTF